jgi:hypothetical protein
MSFNDSGNVTCPERATDDEDYMVDVYRVISW